MYGLNVHYAYMFEFVHVEVNLDIYNVMDLINICTVGFNQGLCIEIKLY